MRVTKKYAGASCLGRHRVYQFRDRAHPTIAEIQLAKQELDHREQRFRLRIERGHNITQVLPTSIPSSVATPMITMPASTSGGGQPIPQQNSVALQQLFMNLAAVHNNTKLLGFNHMPSPSTAENSREHPLPTMRASGPAPAVPPAPQPVAALWAQPLQASQKSVLAPVVSSAQTPSVASTTENVIQQLLHSASKIGKAG